MIRYRSGTLLLLLLAPAAVSSSAVGDPCDFTESRSCTGSGWHFADQEELFCDYSTNRCIAYGTADGQPCPCSESSNLKCTSEFQPERGAFSSVCREKPQLGEACTCPPDEGRFNCCQSPDPSTGATVICQSYTCVADLSERTQGLGEACEVLFTRSDLDNRNSFSLTPPPTAWDNCFEGLRCVEAKCVPGVYKLGEYCEFNWKVDPCDEGLECDFECKPERRLGETCGMFQHQQCVEGNCSSGICTEGPVPIGEDCLPWSGGNLCTDGATCGSNGSNFDGTCYASPRQAGDPCSALDNGGLCDTGLDCVRSSCVAEREKLSVGDACVECAVWDTDCLAGNPVCTGGEDDFVLCSGGTCTVMDDQAGEPCEIFFDRFEYDPTTGQYYNPDSCAPGLACPRGRWIENRTCSHVPAQLDESCAFLVPCDEDLECVDESTGELRPASGVCKNVKRLGDACGCDIDEEDCFSQQCWGEGVFCVGGECKEADVRTRGLGQSCNIVTLPETGDNFSNCQSGLVCNDEGWRGSFCRNYPAVEGETCREWRCAEGLRCACRGEDCNEYECVIDAGLQGDPHMVGFNGLRFDFDGRPGQAFDLVSTPDFRINALIMPDLVHGMTYVGALGVTSSCGHTAVIRADAAEGRLTLEVDDTIQTLGQRDMTVGGLRIAGHSNGDIRVTVAGFTMEAEVHERVFLNVKSMAFTGGVAPFGVDGVLGHTARPGRADAQGLEYEESHYFVDSLLSKVAPMTAPRKMGGGGSAPTNLIAASMLH